MRGAEYDLVDDNGGADGGNGEYCDVDAANGGAANDGNVCDSGNGESVIGG